LLGVVCAAQFLDGMDVSSVGPALPELQRDLQIAPADLQWVVTAYVLGFGGFLLLGGRVADLSSRRRVFLISLSVFALASFVGGVARDALDESRGHEQLSVAAAFTAPAALAILLARFATQETRAKALGVFTAAGPAGFTLGLVIGGALATSTWRLTLLMPAVAAAVLVILGWLAVERDAPDTSGAHLDVGGALTITLGLLRTRGLVRANAVGFALQGGYVGFQFVGQHHGNRGANPLTHFLPMAGDGHKTIRTDGDATNSV
jgi:MFS family permease